MRNKKTLFSVCALLSAAVFATACGETAHTHTFSEDWSKNATDHWHRATCEHIDEISGKQPHLFEDGKCVVCDYPDPDYSDKDNPDTGDTDKDNPGTGDTDKDNPGTGDTDKDNPGTGDTDKDKPDTGDTDKDKPDTGDTDENNLTDAIFDGDFISVTSETEIDRVEDYLIGMTRKIGAGCGFADGDLDCRVLQGNAVLLNYTLAGLAGDIASSKDLSFKQNLRQPNSGALTPINYYAKGDTAFEEYETDTLAYHVEDGCMALAKNVIYNIWGTFSITPSLFEHEAKISYRTEGDYTVLKLDVSTVSNVEGGYGSPGGVLTEQVTVEYVLLDKKVAGLNYFSHSELMYDISQPPASLGDMCVRVLIGSYSFEVPDSADCIESEEQPTWVALEKYPDETVFDRKLYPIDDFTAQNAFDSMVMITRSRAMGGLEAIFTNSNYQIQRKDGKEDRKMIFDLYNAEGIRIRSEKDGEVILTDETKSIVQKDGKKTEKESCIDELYDEFEDDYEDIMYLLMTYASDYTTGTDNYEVNYFMDEDHFVVKFTQNDENGEAIHETTYVFSLFTNSLLGAKDVEKEEDGSTREVTVLCGDYKVEM